MIVNYTAEGWMLIEQADHGRLAAAIAEQLADFPSLPYPDQTLVAIAQHDDHKVRMNAGSHVYVTSLGTPKDFAFVPMHDPVREIEVSRRLGASYQQHPWMGLLASRHAEHLYRGQPTTRSLQNILDSESANRHVWLGKLGRLEEELERAYDVMRFCDRCSLILCQDRVPAMDRRLEITTLIEGTRYELCERADNTLSVAPWPFRETTFELAVTTTCLKQVTFQDDKELAEAMNRATRTTRSFKFVQQSLNIEPAALT